jgi:outer membrane protein assembly complex protein YaeT
LAHLAGILLVLAGSIACKEESGIEVKSLKFTGTKAVTSGQLKSVLATTPSDKLLGIEVPWGTKRYFSREQFEADLKRIVAFYKDRGYPDARVASFDAKLSADQQSVGVTIDIAEGEPVRVERMVLEGLEPLTAERVSQLETRLPLKPGAPLDRALLQASRESVLDELRDHGHPYATVRLGESPGSSERQRVIHLQADPGPIAHHGPIAINGNSSVSDNVVRRQLTFRPGDLYRQSKLVESQRRLYSLETFEFVNVEPQNLEARAAEIPTRVTLTEGKHRKVNVGVGYGTEEKARAEVDWRHVNFFGGARTAGVFARYSSLDRGVRLNLTQPYLFGPRYSLTVSGQSWHNDEPAFVRDTLGGRFTVTRQFGYGGGPVLGSRPSTTASFTYSNEWEEYEIANATLLDPRQRNDLIALGFDPRCGVGPRFCTGAGQLSSISLDATRSTADNVLDARRGYVASVHFQQAGRWLQGDFNFYEMTLEGRYYIPVANRAVIALRARAGSIDGLGVDSEVVPFFKRYFLGGATNLRGWGRFDVSPLSGSGVPIGGQTILNFSTELRVPIWKNLGGVVFVDGGDVWQNPWDFNFGDLRYDAGPGLRYNTPIGPIRVDLGYQLNRIPGLLVNGRQEPRRFRFHFSIGQAF